MTDGQLTALDIAFSDIKIFHLRKVRSAQLDPSSRLARNNNIQKNEITISWLQTAYLFMTDPSWLASALDLGRAQIISFALNPQP